MPEREPAACVDPLIDTAKPRIRWIFTVGTARPCGLVRLAPNTDPAGTWNAGYRYESAEIHCFSHLHSWQLAGVPVMPTDRHNLGPGFSRYASPYDRDSQRVEPGYWSLTLARPAIHVELTSTARVGFHRYRFRGSGPQAVVLDLLADLGPSAMSAAGVERRDERTLQGFVENDTTGRRNRRVRVYFVARFSRDIRTLERLPHDGRSGHGAYIRFAPAQAPLLLKVAVSLTSCAGAARNLEAELPHWDFDRTRRESFQEWNRTLAKIRVEGGSQADTTRFYTDLWRVLSAPQRMADVDGAYCHVSDGRARVLHTPTDASGRPVHEQICGHDGFWNSQWSTNLVLGLAYPDIYRDMCRFLIDFGRDGGLIPRGPTAGTYSYVMISAPSTPFICAAYMKGIHGFDIQAAYRGMKRNAGPGGLMSKAGYEFDTCEGGGIEYYLERGYVPAGRKVPGATHVDGASQTLEYAYQDWALAELAAVLGLEADTTTFAVRSRNYRNLFDPGTGFMRPRTLDGEWLDSFDPLSLEDFCEANSWQYSFHVAQDPQDLIALMGGPAAFVARLDEGFRRTAADDFYARKPNPPRDQVCVNYGNEPGRFVAHLFNHAGAPWLAQKWSRRVKRQTFSSVAPLGFCEDDDVGKAAATSLLLALGLFDVRGGVARDPVYEITCPVFARVTIDLDACWYPGRTFTIEVHGNPTEHAYIQRVELNGEPLSRLWIYHRELVAGGVLRLQAGATPERRLGVAPEDLPPSA